MDIAPEFVFTFHFDSIEIYTAEFIKALLQAHLHFTLILLKYEIEIRAQTVRQKFTFHFDSIEIRCSQIINSLKNKFTFHFDSIEISGRFQMW